MNKMIEVRCPNCGQRMGLKNPHEDAYTCVNCRTVQSIQASVPRPKRITLTKDEFVNIWQHPDKYSEAYVASVLAALVLMPKSQWPEEIRKDYDLYHYRFFIRITLFIILLLLCLTFIVITDLYT